MKLDKESSNNKIKAKLRNNDFVFFFHYLIFRVFLDPILFYLKNWAIEMGIYKADISVQKLSNLKINNKSCIIIGNGPSVRVDDLNKIFDSGMDSFGSNRIIDIYSKTKWRPTYLSVMDTSFLLNVGAKINPKEYIKKSKCEFTKYFFLNSKLKKYIGEDDKVIYLNCALLPNYSNYMDDFSENICNKVTDLGDMTKFNIQIAAYLGYKTIYLYGMDNTYKKFMDCNGKFIIEKDVNSHFSGMVDHQNDNFDDGKNYSKYRAIKEGGFSDDRKNTKGYLECRRYARNHNIKIINLTHGGRVDFFERKEFDEIFSCGGQSLI